MLSQTLLRIPEIADSAVPESVNVLPVIEAVTPTGEDVISKETTGAVVDSAGVPEGLSGGFAVLSKRPITVSTSAPVGTFG